MQHSFLLEETMGDFREGGEFFPSQLFYGFGRARREVVNTYLQRLTLMRPDSSALTPPFYQGGSLRTGVKVLIFYSAPFIPHGDPFGVDVPPGCYSVLSSCVRVW